MRRSDVRARLLRALACYRKLKFREIGRRREARFLGGRASGTVMPD